MISPNWNIFKAKFNENPQKNFEWFCYLLFCNEFDKPVGIFRYKNQSGIETNPIKKGNKTIGWQAKFYETRLAENKSELLGTLDKVKRDYPEINKIILYTNQEWGQGRNKGSNNDPIAKQEVDQKAKDYEIELVWRTASYFESPFVVHSNQEISKYFFSEKNSIIDLIDSRRKRSENILYEIKTSISLPNLQIEINRSQELKSLQEKLNKSQILIVHGIGGVGKTALIKSLYEKEEKNTSIYIFKASEFGSNNTDIFGEFDADTFASSHEQETKKIIVIDSAEKLLDVENIDPFKNSLTAFIKNKWTILFTTRDTYLADLESHLLDCYEVSFEKLSLEILSKDELAKIATDNSFNLPCDENLLELIKNPFYLNEYLRFNNAQNQNYLSFKNSLWKRRIAKTPAREQAFLSLAFQRANEGQFFIIPKQDPKILDELMTDGFIGYETAGYFITHDIYEEWALEKQIDSAFKRKQYSSDFFEEIGEALPIRRSFRSWVSEQLLIDEQSFERFCLDAAVNEEIPVHWRDEIWVSILLSENASRFINQLRNDLIRNDFLLLKRLVFLARLACKEINYETLERIGILPHEIFSYGYVLTKPKGSGWHSLIQFAHENLNKIGLENVKFLIPLINEWTENNSEGKTTHLSSLIALKYYQWLIENNQYISRNDNLSAILKTIACGASSISHELESIFNEILNNGWNSHSDPYFDLVKMTLTEFNAAPIIKALPSKVMELANLFWLQPCQPTRSHLYNRYGWEQDFGLRSNFNKYFPASSFQSPTLILLKTNPIETLDFIINFTNQTASSYYKSKEGSAESEQVEIFISEKQTSKQYISNRLWCAYRGTEVGPDIFNSVHMALEKSLLEQGKLASSETLEQYLLYLLKESQSASITAVVASIVKAYPEKTFNIACILFRTKELFGYDSTRYIRDQTHKSQLIFLRDSFGGPTLRNSIHEKERLSACDLVHHKISLEQLVTSYQIIRGSETSETTFNKRKDLIWEILDKFYEELSVQSNSEVACNIWRLSLARMDCRKMEVTSEAKSNGIQFIFTPKLDPSLKEYSENSTQEITEHFSHTPIKLWATYCKEKDPRANDYPQYNNNPALAIEETKIIVTKLKNNNDFNFILINKDIPLKVCSILLSDYRDKLTLNDKKFCCEIIYEFLETTFLSNYHYQASDGIDYVYHLALPALFEIFQDERENLALILLATLFETSSIDMSGSGYYLFAIFTITTLWQDYPDEMESIIAGYLRLKPHFDSALKSALNENLKQGVHSICKESLYESFFEQHKKSITSFSRGELKLSEVAIEKIVDIETLFVGFSALPSPVLNSAQRNLATFTITCFAKTLLAPHDDRKIDYIIRTYFFEKLALLLLQSEHSDIQAYLAPFFSNFTPSECIADLFESIIIAEDKLKTYDKFWYIWELFSEKIILSCNSHSNQHHYNKMIKSYLFSTVLWKKESKSWSSFGNNEKRFFKKISSEAGHSKAVLYSLALLLNGIAHHYLEDGVYWLSSQLKNNQNLWKEELEQNTVYYLERIVQIFSFNERTRIKKTPHLKQEFLVILNFLVERGSVIGYMVRERIL